MSFSVSRKQNYFAKFLTIANRQMKGSMNAIKQKNFDLFFEKFITFEFQEKIDGFQVFRMSRTISD